MPKKVTKIHSPLRLQVDNLYDLQKVRVMMELRIYAYIKRLGLDKDHIKVKALKKDSDALKAVEVSINKMLKTELMEYPIYVNALKLIKGLAGPRIAGGIIAWTEHYNEETNKIEGIERFDNISKYWKYCGLDVVIDKNTGEGHAPKKVRGEKAMWNSKLRMHLLFKVGEQMIKTDNYFQKLYRDIKKHYVNIHPNPICDCGNIVTVTSSKAGQGYKIFNLDGEKHKCGVVKPRIKYTKGHIHNMARRRMIKILVADIWIIWRKLEGFSVTLPYGMKEGIHSELIYPPEWAHFFKEVKRNE